MHLLHIVYIVGTLHASIPPHEVLGVPATATAREIRAAALRAQWRLQTAAQRGDRSADARLSAVNVARDRMLAEPDAATRFATDVHLRALGAVTARYGARAAPLIQACLDFTTHAQVDRLERLLACDRDLHAGAR